MIRVVSREGARALDSHMINEVGIPGIVLMENAAQAVLAHIQDKKLNNIVILCGGGNNGGDGFSLHRKLNVVGIKSRCICLCSVEKLTGDAAIAYKSANKLSAVHHISNMDELRYVFAQTKCDCIVDCIFGTGLDREVSGIFAEAIAYANEYDAYRIAVDIPSGVCTNTGKILGCAFYANTTVTFQHTKRGLLLYPGRDCAGDVIIQKIGNALPDFNYLDDEFVLNDSDIICVMNRRMRNSYKGNYGKALFITGSNNYSGASVMTTMAAASCGVGLIRALCDTKTACALNIKIPEATTNTFDGSVEDVDIAMLDDCIAWADCISVGTGIGGDIPRVLERVLRSGKKTVIDADGINTLAAHKELHYLLHRNVVLTPHIGEMARLLGKTTQEISESMLASSKQAVEKLQVGAVNLKGTTSIISEYCGRTIYNTTGNSGLAKGGSGDVLAGFTTAIYAQGNNGMTSLSVAAYLLGTGADRIKRLIGEGGVLPHEIADNIGFSDE